MMGLCAGSQITCSDDEDDEVEKLDKNHLMIEEDEDDDKDEEVEEIEEEEIIEAVGEDLDDDEEEEEEEGYVDEEEGEDEYTDAMEAMDVDDYTASQSDRESVEEIDGSVTSIKKKKSSKRRRGVGTGLNGLGGMIEAAMRFGQELQDDYRDDKREEIKKALEVS